MKPVSHRKKDASTTVLINYKALGINFALGSMQIVSKNFLKTGVPLGFPSDLFQSSSQWQKKLCCQEEEMFEIFCSYSSKKKILSSLSAKKFAFSVLTPQVTNRERNKNTGLSLLCREIYRKTQYNTTSKAFWQFVTIRWFFPTYSSSFCKAADPRMTKAVTTTTKKKTKYKKYYCDLLQTTTKQCNHSLYSIMQIHFKTAGTPGCLPHRHRGRRRKELDRISIGAAKLKNYSCTCTLVFYPEQSADEHSTYRTQ